MTHTPGTRSRSLLVLVLGVLTCLGPLAIDLYLPAMPAIAQSMGEPLGRIQLSLSAYTLSFAMGQVIFGSLSDRFGRMRVMVPGLVAYVATNVLSAMAESANQLIIFRALQAFAGAAVMVCIPAMVRDLFPREECARILSSVLLVMTVAPLLAPILGGQILYYSSWPMLFIFLALFACLALVLALFMLRESLPEHGRLSLKPKELLQAYWEVVSHRQAMGCILAHGFFFGGLFAFVSASPFVYIELYQIPVSQYGLLFAMNIIGMALCNIINMRLMGRFALTSLLAFGSAVSCLAGLVLLANAWSGFGGLAGVVIPVVVFIACLGFTGPNSNAKALSYFPRTAGTANGAAGVIRFGIAGVTAGLAGVLHDGTAVPMAAIMAGCGLLSILSLALLRGEQELDQGAEQDTVEGELVEKRAA